MQFPHLKEALPRHEFQFKIVSMTKDQDGSIPVRIFWYSLQCASDRAATSPLTSVRCEFVQVPKSVLKSIINWLVPPAVKKSVVESMPRELGYMLTRQSTQKVSVAASVRTAVILREHSFATKHATVLWSSRKPV